MSTTRYQEGSVERVKRAKGPDVWVYRWRELQEDGTRAQRKRVLGDLSRLPTRAAARREVENFRAEINARQDRIGKMTVGEAWGHFQLHELRDPGVGRSHTTITVYCDYFRSQILPEWGEVLLDDVKPVAVEKWLRGLDRAAGTKAKIRNLLSALFSHCIRHEIYTKLNPIASVRQSAQREKEPEVLTIAEMQGIIRNIGEPAIRVMVTVAAVSALRRSELRGLQWADIDIPNLLISLKRGYVGLGETAMKTKASRKGIPMSPELAAILVEWRGECLYPTGADWVFASPHTGGARPYWPESAMRNHVRHAALLAGVEKHIGWHTFRHSLATHLGQHGEDVKVVQELLRHANSKITQDVYQQASQDAKRAAVGKMSGIFVVAAKSA